jgi:hypothetical protein
MPAARTFAKVACHHILWLTPNWRSETNPADVWEFMTSTTHRIPWARVLAEGVVIVVSILLAFGIDAWWAKTQASEEERAILSGIQEEFGENREVLDKLILRLEAAQADLGWFLGLSPAEAGRIPRDSVERHVAIPIHRTFSTGLSTGFLDATVSSGKLGLVRSPALRAALARTTAIQADVAEPFALAMEYNREAMLLLGQHPEIQQGPPQLGSTGWSQSTLESIRSDKALMALVTAKRSFTFGYITELRRLKAHLEEVLTAIQIQTG